jgi:hypothetical protein
MKKNIIFIILTFFVFFTLSANEFNVKNQDNNFRFSKSSVTSFSTSTDEKMAELDLIQKFRTFQGIGIATLTSGTIVTLVTLSVGLPLLIWYYPASFSNSYPSYYYYGSSPSTSYYFGLSFFIVLSAFGAILDVVAIVTLALCGYYFNLAEHKNVSLLMDSDTKSSRVGVAIKF